MLLVKLSKVNTICYSPSLISRVILPHIVIACFGCPFMQESAELQFCCQDKPIAGLFWKSTMKEYAYLPINRVLIEEVRVRQTQTRNMSQMCKTNWPQQTSLPAGINVTTYGVN